MRKTLMIVFLALLSVALVSGYADAISGQCGSCHTMHNSQNGSAVDAAGPNDNLTKYSCLGCHGGSISGAPNILAETNQTAGGTFNDTVIDSDAKVHNVVDLDTLLGEGLESVITTTPGNSGSLITLGPTEITCAGSKGCHGDHTKTGSALGIKGFHHAASTKGYRFLQTADGTPVNINGVGSLDWEKTSPGQSNHNVYDADGTDSISVLCAQCHGGFHGSGNTGSTSPFQLHPTDEEAVIANIDGAGWTPSTDEVKETPFGFTSTQIANGMITTDMTTGTPYTTGNGKAVCVSCHRAHGSAQNDLLRFNYSNMNAGAGGNNAGCETCHTAQR